MLERLSIRGFKSLADVEIELPRISVFFGPNAAGKSNLLDAMQALARIGTERTLADALGEPIRGYPVEAFALPSGGLNELLGREHAEFSLRSDLRIGESSYRYQVTVGIDPRSGRLSTEDEYLAELSKKRDPKGNPVIERKESELFVRRRGKPAHPRQEPLKLNHTIVSDLRWGGDEYPGLEAVREELSGWRTYYLDPRVAMRAAQPPAEVEDLGTLGGAIAPYLYRLHAEKPRHFAAVVRTLRSVVPTVEDLRVDLDRNRGTLELLVRQDGVDFSSRIISEGTLRVLALCSMVANPWAGSLVAFEEPENGVHPRRLELIAQLLLSLALDGSRQVVLTTHSPVFCAAVLRSARSHPDDVALFNVRRRGSQTIVTRFESDGPLFQDREIQAALAAPTEDGVFEGLLLRGYLDE